MVDGSSTHEVGGRASEWVDEKKVTIVEEEVWSMKVEKDVSSGARASHGLPPPRRTQPPSTISFARRAR